MPHTGRTFVPEALLLDIPEIEAEPESIFNLLAGLKTGSLDINCSDTDLAEKLLMELREHFAGEERLAQEAHEDFAGHAKKHEELLRMVAGLLVMILSGRSSSFAVQRYVEYWNERGNNEGEQPGAPPAPLVEKN